MAPNAVVDAGNAFFAVLGQCLCGLVRMASIAGVALEVSADMAGRAIGVVVAIKSEVAIMREGGGLPCARSMALHARQVLTSVKRITRRYMAGLTAIPQACLQQGVIKAGSGGLGEFG